MRVKHRGAELPHLGGKGSSEHRGARANSAIVGAWMPEVFEIKKEAILSGDYHLCSTQNPAPIAVVASSFATLSIGEIRLPATTEGIITVMTQIQNPKLTAQLQSTYSMSAA